MMIMLMKYEIAAIFLNKHFIWEMCVTCMLQIKLGSDLFLKNHFH